MREIRKLNATDIDEYIKMVYNTYPSFKDYSPEGKNNLKELILDRYNDNNTHYYAMYDNDKLLSVMRLFDFKMNYYGKLVNASGLASLAVDLLVKKQGIAKEMIEFYENFYLSNNNYIAILLPFKTDFYYNLGYGYGSKINRYRFKAHSLKSKK